MAESNALYPLSALQHGMLFHSLAAPRSGVDIEQMLWDLPELLDPTVYHQAWEQVVARHDVLRTAFRWAGVPEPRQEVVREINLPWSRLDWREADAAEQTRRLDEFLVADRERGFELDHAPLLRLTLIQLATAHWKLVWTFHHAILDGRSFPPLVQEVFAFYDAGRRGEKLSLAPAPAFREHVAWLRQLDHAAAEAFWRRTLRGFAAPTPLTVDRSTATMPSKGGPCALRTACELRFSTASTDALRHFAQTGAVSLGTLVQAAWAILHSRYSRQRDIVFGVTRACRPPAPPGSEAAIGLFINTLPLRIDVDPARPLAAWLRDVRTRWAALRPHEQTPLVQVRTWSEVASGQPLFESLVVFENYQLEERLRSLGGAWSRRSFELIEQTNFPLTLAGYDGAQLALTLQFDPGRFDSATARRMLGHLGTLLGAMPAGAELPVRDLPLLPIAEQEELLARGGTSTARFAPEATLVSWFEARVETAPGRIAVVGDDRGTRTELTYRELNDRANVLARRLAQHGVVPETLVGLFLERSVELVVGILGILKAGGAYVPLEASGPPERLAFMIGDAALSVVVTQRSLREKLPPGPTVISVDDPVSPTGLAGGQAPQGAGVALAIEALAEKAAPGGSVALRAAGAKGTSSPAVMPPRAERPAHLSIRPQGRPIDSSAAPPPAGRLRTTEAHATAVTHPPSANNLAYVIYTSGSTGQPKGTLVTHHNVVRLFRGTARWFDFNADDVWTLFHSSAFDFSVWELWGALLYGGKLVIVPWLVSRSPDAFRALLGREQVTVLNQTPSAFRQLIHADASAPSGEDLALRLVILGGEALELRSLAPWFARHGDQHPRLVNMYGITETTVHVTYRAITSADLAAGSVIGMPLPDLQLYVLDEDLRPVPIGVPGELFVGGDGLARGYLNRPDLTAARFLPNPFQPGTRLYRTGDRARWTPDRDLAYLGRLDQQVKIRGFRIEPGEIEALLRRHPAIRDAVIMVRDDHDERRLVAYLVPTAADANPGDLRAYLQPHLPDYMIPSAFVRLARLPLTENGKLDRRALPAPEPQRPELATPYVAPRTPAEQALATAWREVLRVSQVGVNDSFFELGGNSLQLVQLLGHVGAAFPQPVQLADLFQYPTVRMLAAHLAQPAGAARLEAVQARARRQLAARPRRA